MRATLTTLLLIASLGHAANAATGIFGSYLFLDVDGAASTFGLTKNGAASTPDFAGVDFGAFDPSGMTLTLLGGEANTYKNNGGNVTGAALYYSVYPSGGSAASFVGVPLSFKANTPYTDAGGVPINGFGDQAWSNDAAAVDLLNGLSAGDYNLEVYVQAFTNQGDQYHNAGGANYTATFSVAAVPEVTPALALPVLIGAVAATRALRRKRRAVCCA